MTTIKHWVCYEVNPNDETAHYDCDWHIESFAEEAHMRAEEWTMEPWLEKLIAEGDHVRIFVAQVVYPTPDEDMNLHDYDPFENEVPDSRIVLLEKNIPLSEAEWYCQEGYDYVLPITTGEPVFRPETGWKPMKTKIASVEAVNAEDHDLDPAFDWARVVHSGGRHEFFCLRKYTELAEA